MERGDMWMWAAGNGSGSGCWDVHRVGMLCNAMYRGDGVVSMGVLQCKLDG